MRKVAPLVFLPILLAICFSLILKESEQANEHNIVLELYCAAGLQKPISELARLYKKEHNVRVLVTFGGSGQLLARLNIASGDLYLPTDQSYIDIARQQDLIKISTPVSRLEAVIIVQKGNPKGIQKLADLSKKNVRVALAERSAGIGKLSHALLKDEELLDRIESGELSKVSTVSEVALQVQIGASDAGIVWDALIPQFPDCEFVKLNHANKSLITSTATVGLLKSSNHQKEAINFIEFLTEKNTGLRVFEKYGFCIDHKNESP